jgi:PE family
MEAALSYVIALPEMLAAASSDVAGIGSSLSAAHTAAAAPTVALVPAAADEVSASIAHLFSHYAEGYQAVAGQAAAFHEQFIQNLNASARSYASTEAANTSSLRSLAASTGSHASANTAALLPINVTFSEAFTVLLLLLAGSLALAWQLLLLISHLPITF